jgi:hypothetical protein
MAFHKLSNNFSVTLNGAIGANDTSINLSGILTPITSILPVYLTIEGEVIEVTAVVGQTATVVRGQDGTSNAAHADATPVEAFMIAAHFNELIDGKEDTGSSPVFGTNFYSDKITSQLGNATTTPLTYHSFITGVLEAGTYFIAAYSACTGGAASQMGFRRIKIDGTDFSYMQWEPKDINNTDPWAPSGIFTSTGGASTIILEFGKVSGSSAITMIESTFTLWRVL